MCVSGGRGGWKVAVFLIQRAQVLVRNFEKKTMIGGTKILFCEHGLKFNPLLRGANSISKAV